MEYVKCRDVPTTQKILPVLRCTERQALEYAIENRWRVVVYAGGKNYYLKGKDDSVGTRWRRLREKVLVTE